mgnify:CR=1 FL=1
MRRLLREIYTQIILTESYLDVQVLVEIDSKQITTGAKRNKLLYRAVGKYVCYIDDDDHILPDYVKSILDKIIEDSDCIATTGYYSVNGGNKVKWKLSKSYENVDGIENGEPMLYRKTNHLSPVKRELALTAQFPDKSNAEDKEYSERLNPLLKTESVIDIPIYYYDYSTHDKEYT